MKEGAKLKIAWSVAILSLSAGLGMCRYTMMNAPRRIKQLERKANDCARLSELGQGASDIARIVGAMESMPSRQPRPLRELLKEAMPGVEADVRPSKVVSEQPEWVVRRQVVVLGQVALKDMGKFLVRVEQERPPWRLVECTIEAVERGPGYGSASLVLETLIKDGP